MQAKKDRIYLKEVHDQRVHGKRQQNSIVTGVQGQGVRRQADQWVTFLGLPTLQWLIKGFCGFLQAVHHPFQQIVTAWSTNDDEKGQ